MSAYSDAGTNYYRAQLVRTDGQLNDLELQWLQMQGATSDDLNDAWDEFLEIAEPFVTPAR